MSSNRADRSSKFLEHYFKNANEASRKGVSLAQQVEQRGRWRSNTPSSCARCSTRVPVQEGVREFLFQVWADVLAMTAVKSGGAQRGTKP